MSRYWGRWKYGEHKRGVRVAWGAAESNSSLLMLHISAYTLMVNTSSGTVNLLMHLGDILRRLLRSQQLEEWFIDILSMLNGNMWHTALLNLIKWIFKLCCKTLYPTQADHSQTAVWKSAEINFFGSFVSWCHQYCSTWIVYQPYSPHSDRF